MEKNLMLASAGAVVLVVATGSAAVGVNLGLMQAADERSEVGHLEIVAASAELAPPVETVIIEEEVIIPAPEPEPAAAPGPETAPVAAPAPAPTPAATTPPSPRPIDATRAVAIALTTVGDGSLISVEGEWSSGSAMFEVELRLPDGRLAEILIDGTTGAVMGIEFEQIPAAPATTYYADDDHHDDDDDDDDDDHDYDDDDDDDEDDD